MRYDGLEIGLDVFVPRVIRPSSGRSAKENVLHICFCTVGDQQLDHVQMSIPGGLMKRRGVRMTADRVEAIWVFARIQ